MKSSSLKNKCQLSFKGLLKVFIFAFVISNAAAEETIIIVGDPIDPPRPSPIVIITPGGGGGGGDGSFGGGGGGGESQVECTKRVNTLESQCNVLYGGMAVVTVGMCTRLGLISKSWGASCLAAASGTAYQAQQWCSDNGDRLRKEQCGVP